MGGIKMAVPKCSECQDCQQMVSLYKIGETSGYKCYGYVPPFNFELKREICEGKNLPTTSPEWCPKRMAI
jgi:hypothetical protein